MLAFAKGLLKLALAIALAFVIAAAIVAGGYTFIDDREKARLRADAEPYEKVARRQIDLKKPLDLAFTVETKVVEGNLYVSIKADGHPKYLQHPTNRSNGFILEFYDRDGFKLYNKFIPVKEFTTIVAEQNPTGLSFQFKEFISLNDYKRFSSASIGWTVDEKLIPATAQPNLPAPSKPTVASPDPCAPGLPKSERLRRLAALGDVRQLANDSYSAGGRRVIFSGDYLISCN